MSEFTAWVFDSDRLFRIAKAAAEEADAHARTRKGQDAAVVAVLFSAAALEGYINELADWAALNTNPREPHIENYARLLSEAEQQRGSTRLKWHLLSMVSTGSTVNLGERPSQDLMLLLRIRDELVHLKPERYRTGEEHRRKVIKELAHRGVVAKDPEFFSSWLDELSIPTVATWAVETARNAVEKIVNDMPDGYFKSKMEKNFKMVFPA